MRSLYDALDPANIPADAQCIAFYVDVLSPAAAAARWPGRALLSIARTESEDAACLDVESGDATPVQAPAWVARQRARGVVFPWVYCSQSPWATVQVAFRVQGVAEPLWWIAAPAPDLTLLPGTVATQRQYLGTYDVSALADQVPGLDPAEEAAEDDMGYTLSRMWNGQQDSVSIDGAGAVWHRWFTTGPSWDEEQLPAGPVAAVAGTLSGYIDSVGAAHVCALGVDGSELHWWQQPAGTWNVQRIGSSHPPVVIAPPPPATVSAPAYDFTGTATPVAAAVTLPAAG